MEDMKLNEYHLQNGLPEVWVLKQLDNKPYTKDDIRIFDNTDLPFILDEEVLGKWNVCDFVPHIEMHNPDKPNWSMEDVYWKIVEFRSDGSCTIVYGNGKRYESPSVTWTKGYVHSHMTKCAERYVIRRKKGCDYLFIQWKSGDYTFGKREPKYYVFRRE